MRGFILINTIYILTLLALLILTLQKNILLDIKIINELNILHNNFYELESSALEILPNIDFANIADNCVLSNQKNLFAYQNIKRVGCKGISKINSDVFYTITDLGEYPCIRTLIEDSDYPTHHYLINFIEKKLFAKILQIRYVVPEEKIAPILQKSAFDRNLTCKKTMSRYIPPGILSWNLIYNF